MEVFSSLKPPLLGFITGGGEGEGAPPQPRKRKRGPRKPRRDFLASPSSLSEVEEAAQCLLLLSDGHWVWVEDHHHHHPSSAVSEASADSEAEEEEKKKKKKKRGYTCVTCGRTFDSFQALGGHRAYHSKDRPMEEPKRSTVMPAGKDHRCNVCEKVFPSGQALGGHMRSHYNAHAQPKKEKEPCRAVPITGQFDLNLPAVPEY